MALVTGTLTDFGAGSLASYQPRIHFHPSGPAVDAGKLLASKTLTTTPAADKTWSINLEPTLVLHPDCWYTTVIEWLAGDGSYVQKNFIDWKLRVPPEGGAFGVLVEAPSNPAQVWVGLEPPTNPTPGTWWLVADPDNPDDTANTGDLYEWR